MSATRQILNTVTEGRRRPGSWVIQSMRGINIDDIGSGGVLVIAQSDNVEVYNSAAPLGYSNKTRRVGILGAGKDGSYGPVGSQVEIDIDRNANYQPLGGYGATWKIVGYAEPTSQAVKQNKISALYHFD